MSNTLSPELLAQIFAQQSEDPFLTLVTLSHPSFAQDIRLVNNSTDIVSRGNTYQAFPILIRLPVDDGETARNFTMDFDNASLELIEEIRSVTTQIKVKLEMILASLPDAVQMEQPERSIITLTYNARSIRANVVLDNFLSVEVTSEKYGPGNFPGIF